MLLSVSPIAKSLLLTLRFKLNKKKITLQSAHYLGPVAQLVEHYLDMVVVDGSSPFGATILHMKFPII